MTRQRRAPTNSTIVHAGSPPELNVSMIGIVSRDYRKHAPNGYRDFSHALPTVLATLDAAGCDAVLFSLFSIVPRTSYDPRGAFTNLKHIKAVFLEEFRDEGRKRSPGRYVVYFKNPPQWEEYHFFQAFGRISGMPRRRIEDFVENALRNRILGNCCVLLCGETNGVKYSKEHGGIRDTFKLREAIPKNVEIVLNPIHDRMTRFEMKLKRQFLSEYGRWVISVWNKGRINKNGNVRDGDRPAWTVFHNGNEITLAGIPNDVGLEIAILDINNAGQGKEDGKL